MPPFRESPTQRFEAVANFRDLGGHTTRDGARVARGRLFRSGHLARASDDDVEQLARLGLRQVFDFRTLADIEHEGADRLPEGTHHHRLPMPDPARHEDLRTMLLGADMEEMERVFGDGRSVQMMLDAASRLVTERRDAYREFLVKLAAADAVPALFHCSAGKDRAGWAGSVVLLSLGVDEEQVVEQYLLSNRAAREIFAQSRTGGDAGRFADRTEAEEKLAGRLLQPFLTVRREYIEASFAAVREHWGSFDAYLVEGLGIDERLRQGLREHLLA